MSIFPAAYYRNFEDRDIEFILRGQKSSKKQKGAIVLPMTPHVSIW